MKNAYPVILTQGEKNIVVFIPDFGVNTEGNNIAEAMEMARDAIGLMGIDMQDEGESLPQPSDLASVKTDGIVTLVDVDFTEYRRKHDITCVRKNCTIPSWLNEEAERAGLNFSAVLQKGLKRELQISEA